MSLRDRGGDGMGWVGCSRGREAFVLDLFICIECQVVTIDNDLLKVFGMTVLCSSMC